MAKKYIPNLAPVLALALSALLAPAAREEVERWKNVITSAYVTLD